MATFKHNKKKNLLLVWEFFSYHMANMILENKSIEQGKEILARHIFGNKDLHAEFEIIKTLVEVKNLKNQEVASKLLAKLEEAAKKIDLKSSEYGKNKLLAEVAQLKDEKFFDRKINPEHYRTSALAHTLVSHWMGRPGVSLLEVARLEDYFMQLFLTQDSEIKINENVLELDKKDIDQLVVHVMNNKFNELYSKELNEAQKIVLKEWIFVQDNLETENNKFSGKLSEIRKETSLFLEEEYKKALAKNKESYAKTLKESLDKISDYSKKELNDDFVAFHLGLIGLVEELQEASSIKEGEA